MIGHLMRVTGTRGTLPFKAVLLLASLATAWVGVRLLRLLSYDLLRYRPSGRGEALAVAAFVLFPSTLWVTSYSIYRDAVIYLLAMASVYAVYRVYVRRERGFAVLAVLSVTALVGFRWYAALAVVGGLVAWFLLVGGGGRRFYVRLFGLLVAVLVVLYVLLQGLVEQVVGYVEFRTLYFEQTEAGSNIGVSYSRASPWLWLPLFAYSLVSNVIGPLPHQINSGTTLAGFLLEVPLLGLVIWRVARSPLSRRAGGAPPHLRRRCLVLPHRGLQRQLGDRTPPPRPRVPVPVPPGHRRRGPPAARPPQVVVERGHDAGRGQSAPPTAMTTPSAVRPAAPPALVQHPRLRHAPEAAAGGGSGAAPPLRTVAIVGNQPFALARFRSLLIRDLVRQGHRVVALSPGWDRDPSSRDLVRSHGAETVEIVFDRSATGPLAELRSVLSIRAVLRSIGPDAVFSYFVKPVVYTAAATVGLGVPQRVAMIEGLGTAGQAGWQRRAATLVFRAAARAYDTLFVLNEEDQAYFLEDVGAPERSVRRVEGIGIDLDEFTYAPPPARESPTFLFVARMLRQKGVWDFVEAAGRVKREAPNARFVMLGGADDSYDAVDGAELAARTEAAGIEWLGHVDDVGRHLRDADVFVLPSFYREGYPRSIMEAMATGRAVITTDNPGCREAVTDGLNGLLVPPRDPAALAEAMRSLCGRPGRVAEMGREGRRLAEARYDYRRINAAVIAALVGETPGMDR